MTSYVLSFSGTAELYLSLCSASAPIKRWFSWAGPGTPGPPPPVQSQCSSVPLQVDLHRINLTQLMFNFKSCFFFVFLFWWAGQMLCQIYSQLIAQFHVLKCALVCLKPADLQKKRFQECGSEWTLLWKLNWPGKSLRSLARVLGVCKSAGIEDSSGQDCHFNGGVGCGWRHEQKSVWLWSTFGTPSSFSSWADFGAILE